MTAHDADSFADLDRVIAEGVILDIVNVLQTHGYELPTDHRRYRVLWHTADVIGRLVDVYEGRSAVPDDGVADVG